MKSTRLASIAALALVTVAAAPTPSRAEDAYLRVVDVGNGLCVIAKSPGGKVMLYDAGDHGTFCRDAVRELVPADGRLDLVVLSHSDADHIRELPAILGERSAGTIIYPGDAHIEITGPIVKTRAAIDIAKTQGATVWNLGTTPLPQLNDEPDALARRTFSLGSAKATIVAGWGDANEVLEPGDDEFEQGEHNNAVSIVVRYEFAGHAVLLTGDTVGRLIEDAPATCKYAEKKMVDQQTVWPLKSDVLIGQHHGADNASSNCFIDAVKPRFVVFSAGHKNYRHPRNSTVRRFLKADVRPDDIFRTDRADHEPWKKGKKWREQEWIYGSIKGCVDKAGDDDVEIWLPDDPAADVRVNYRNSYAGC